MQKDYSDHIRKCDRYQRYDHLIHQSTTTLTTLSKPFPFAQWGIDILGPFSPAQGQKKFILVAVDYFTKWIKVEATVKITKQVIWKFI